VWAAIVSIQLFIPPFIGIANNGDFAKVTGLLCLSVADGGTQNFEFFQPDYLRGPEHCWDSGKRTSQTALAWVASSAQQLAGPAGRFDIRWMGALHAALFAVFLVLFLQTIAPLPLRASVPVAAAALWMFTDVSLVSIFNSFFSDTAAVLGAVLMTVLAVRISLRDRTGLAWWLAFALAASLFITSKPQHAVFGVVPAAFAAAGAVRAHRRPARYFAATVAAGLVGCSLWMLATITPYENGQARFNLIFSKLALRSKSPAQDLAELGLPAGDVKYIGLNAYSPGGPASDEEWLREFFSRANNRAMLAFYARHPDRAFDVIDSDLRTWGYNRRQLNLSNFRKQDGRARHERTTRFASWSNFRAGHFQRWPWHIGVWYAVVLAGSVVLVRSQERRVARLAWVAIGISLIAIGEFLLATLADAAETDRHLFLFHVFTDLTMLFALAFATTFLDRRFARRDP
jgi:hypothetical protein